MTLEEKLQELTSCCTGWDCKHWEQIKAALTCQSCKTENPRMTVCSNCIPNPSYSQEELDKAVSATRQQTIEKVLSVKPEEVEAWGNESLKSMVEGYNTALTEWEQRIKSLTKDTL